MAIAARLHGVPRLVVEAEERPLERKTAGLLAYLAAQGTCSRSTLATLLWPDAAPEGARNNLRQVLFKLKKAAQGDVVVGAEALSLAEGVCCLAGEPAAGETLLAGCDYADCPEFLDWLSGERERIASRSAAHLVGEAESRESQGDIEGALGAALDLLRVAPLEESHHRRVMRLHYLRGDRAAALAAFEHCGRVLREALDAEPESATRALAASFATESVPRPAPSRVVPVTLVRPPRLVGRDAELAAMHAAWSGEKAFVLLGEAGLGKSRLVAELAEGSAAIVTACARPGDRSIPYVSLARLLRALVEPRPGLVEEGARIELGRLMPELCHDSAPHGEARPRILQAAIAALLRRARAAGVEALVLDDLHFADAASLEMLNELALEGTATRWGFAQRPAEGPPEARALQETLGEAWKLDTIRLAPLDEPQMAELLETLRIPGIVPGRLAPQLLKATGGNPLFALETLKSAVIAGAGFGEDRGGLPRPASVGALIERRLSQLSPRALSLARAAAIAGVDFDAEIASEVLREPPVALVDAWRELEEAQVLVDAAFAHDLIYEATLRGVPAPIARHAHGVIGACLERRGGAPERIAEHWIGAGEVLRAVPFLKAAAVKAEAAVRYGEARGWLERAIALTSGAGMTKETLELRFLLIELLKESAQAKDVMAVIEAARPEAVSADERFQLARVETQALTACGDSPAAKALAMRFLEDEELCAEADPLRVAELRFMLGCTYITDFEGGPAIALLEPLEPVFRDHPDLQFRGWFYQDLIRALYTTDRVAEAEAWVPKTLDIARQVGRKRMVSGVMLFAANAAAAAGRIAEPFERVREAQLLIAERDDSSLGRVFHVLAGDYLARQGRYREALAALEAAEASSGLMTPVFHGRMQEAHALVLAQLGEAHAARMRLQAANAHVSTGALRRLRLVHRLETLQLVGDPVEEPLREYESLLDDLAPLSTRWRGRFFAAAAGPVSDDFGAIAASARSAGLMGHALAAHVAGARSAAQARDGDAAVAHARQALELLRKFTLTAAYRPALWLACYRAARDFDASVAAEALQAGAGWVETVARYHVPEARREAFLRANRVNRALVTPE